MEYIVNAACSQGYPKVLIAGCGAHAIGQFHVATKEFDSDASHVAEYSTFSYKVMV